jgi:transcription-repair coupling factor (superfamily II helicase)
VNNLHNNHINNIATNLLENGFSSTENNLIILNSQGAASKIYKILMSLFPEDNFVHLPNSEILPYDFFSTPPNIRSERINALSELTNQSNKTLISSIQTLMSPCSNYLHVSNINNLKLGDPFLRESVIIDLENNGYKRTEIVTESGDYSLRGNIIDLFLSGTSQPIRLEIYDERIESIRFFDPRTQLTTKKIGEVNSLPAYEYPKDDNGASKFQENWRINFDTFEKDSDIFNRVMNKRKAEGVEMYLPLFFSTKPSILQFINKFNNVYVDQDTLQSANEFQKLIENRYEEYRYDIERPLLHPKKLFTEYSEITQLFTREQIKDFNAEYFEEDSEDLIKPEPILKDTVKPLHTLPKEGDLVVHLSHGIGRFVGLKQLDSFVGRTECLQIEYSEKSKVYVPIEHMNLVSKYFGPEDKTLDTLGSTRWQKRKEKALRQTFDTAAELLEMQARRESKVGYKYAIPKKELDDFSSKFPYQETFDQNRTINEVINDLSVNRPMDRLVCGEVGFGKTEVAMRASFIASYNSKQTCILVPTTLLASQHYKTFKERFEGTGISIGIISRNLTKNEKANTLSDLESGNIDILIGTHAVIQDSVKFHDLGLLIIDEEHRFGVRQKEKIKSLKEEVDILSLSATPIPRSLNFALAELKDFSIIATAPNNRLAVRTFVHKYNQNLINEAIQRELMRSGQSYYLCNDLRLVSDRKARIEEAFPDLRVGIVHGKLKPAEIEKTMIAFNKGDIDVLVCSTIIESGIDVSNANTLIVEQADRLGLAQLHQLRGRVGRGEKQAYSYFLKSNSLINQKAAQSRLEALVDTDSLAAGFLLALKDLEIRGAGEILGSNQSGVFDSIGLDLYSRLLKKATDYIKRGILDFEELDKSPEINLGMSTYIPDDYLPDLNQRLLMYNRISSANSKEELHELKIEMINRFGLFPEELSNLFLQNEIKLMALENSVSKVNVKKEKIDIFYNGSDQSTTIINPDKLDQRIETINAVIQVTGTRINA